jgi:hypothetical protein
MTLGGEAGGAIGTLIEPGAGTVIGAAIGVGVVGAGIAIVYLWDRIKPDECNKGQCKPCIPPVGTIAGDVNKVPPSRPHWPLTVDHVHWYEMNQSPYPECRCFWKRNVTKPTPGSSLPSGVPQVTPPAGGGPM